MPSLRGPEPYSSTPLPSSLSALSRLLAYTQALGLERHRHRPTRGIPTLVLVLAPLWLVLAWRSSSRPQQLAGLDEPLLAALQGRRRLPSATTLYRSLGRFSVHGIRAAVQAACVTDWQRRAGRIWVTLDSHERPYRGRRKRDRFEKGWAGNHGRRLRDDRLFLAIDTMTGQVVTYLLVRGGTPGAALAVLLARRVRHLLGRPGGWPRHLHRGTLHCPAPTLGAIARAPFAPALGAPRRPTRGLSSTPASTLEGGGRRSDLPTYRAALKRPTHPLRTAIRRGASPFGRTEDTGLHDCQNLSESLLCHRAAKATTLADGAGECGTRRFAGLRRGLKVTQESLPREVNCTRESLRPRGSQFAGGIPRWDSHRHRGEELAGPIAG